MKILSLFDGISCARVALERAGIPVEVYYASEIEQKPIEISKKNYPDIIQLGDVTTLNERFDMDENFANGIDLICGGSPCQSFSNAGSKTGFDGKSGLFWEFAKLVKKMKPKYFLLENVKMKQEWQDIISEELGVKPIEINSSLVSGQSRKRLYWTNIPNIIQPEDKGIYLKDVLQDQVDEKYYLNESQIKTINRNFGSKGKTIHLEESLIEKITYPSRINQKSLNIKSPTLVAAMGMGGGNVPVIIRNNSLSIKEKSNTIRTSGRGSGVDDKHNWDEIRLANNRIRKLTEIECERLQTLPDNYTQGVSSTARYKAIGNGWTVDVIAHILSFIK
jgi:site-specific DNA-cytosine methylase